MRLRQRQLPPDFFKLEHPEHCVHCEGLDPSIRNPIHHPSYEITTSCNLSCAYCYSKVAVLRGTAPKEGYYGDERPRVITISQYGEPLMAGIERVAEIIESLRERFGNVRIDLQTNGTFEFSELDGLVDVVMVSLDVASREKYVRLTGRDLFESVVKNIERAADMDCTLTVRSVYLPGFNDDELVRLSEMLSDMGVDEHFIQPCSVYRECLEDLERLGFRLERAGVMGDYLKVVNRCRKNVKAVIPGCIKVVIDELLSSLEDPYEILLLRRNPVSSEPPRIRRRYLFHV